jgi:hypothetical protein
MGTKRMTLLARTEDGGRSEQPARGHDKVPTDGHEEVPTPRSILTTG